MSGGRPNRLPAVAVVLTGAAFALAFHPGAAVAAPPANDAFANAEVLTADPPFEVTGTNAEATAEPGEPLHADQDGGASIWYRWTPSSDVVVRIATCRSDFDTLLGVYRGSAVDGLATVESSDDGCNFPAERGSEVIFVAEAGVTYQIAVDGFNGATGTVSLTIATLPPANDDFQDSQELSGPAPVEVAGTNVFATSEPGEPSHVFAGGVSVWYRWTAPATGPVTFQVCGNDFDSALAIYTGDRVDELTRVARNDEASCGVSRYLGSRVTFDALAGTTYHVAVDGFFFESGFLRLRIPKRPPNDAFANAQTVSGALPLTVPGTNFEATREPGEPRHAGGAGGASVWYRWTPQTGGPVEIGTCGSAFDTSARRLPGCRARDARRGGGE